MFIFTYSGYSFIHSSKFFESPQFSHLFSFCTKTSPDHVTVTSHPKWRLIVNFLKNSHSFSEYSIFTYSFALLYILYIVYFVFRAILFHKCHKIQIFLFFFHNYLPYSVPYGSSPNYRYFSFFWLVFFHLAFGLTA